MKQTKFEKWLSDYQHRYQCMPSLEKIWHAGADHKEYEMLEFAKWYKADSTSPYGTYPVDYVNYMDNENTAYNHWKNVLKKHCYDA